MCNNCNITLEHTTQNTIGLVCLIICNSILFKSILSVLVLNTYFKSKCYLEIDDFPTFTLHFMLKRQAEADTVSCKKK